MRETRELSSRRGLEHPRGMVFASRGDIATIPDRRLRKLLPDSVHLLAFKSNIELGTTLRDYVRQYFAATLDARGRQT